MNHFLRFFFGGLVSGLPGVDGGHQLLGFVFFFLFLKDGMATTVRECVFFCQVLPPQRRNGLTCLVPT